MKTILTIAVLSLSSTLLGAEEKKITWSFHLISLEMEGRKVPKVVGELRVKYNTKFFWEPKFIASGGAEHFETSVSHEAKRVRYEKDGLCVIPVDFEFEGILDTLSIDKLSYSCCIDSQIGVKTSETNTKFLSLLNKEGAKSVALKLVWLKHPTLTVEESMLRIKELNDRKLKTDPSNKKLSPTK